jgi:hypothetical protein
LYLIVGPLSLDAAGLMTLVLGQIAAMLIGCSDGARQRANQQSDISKHVPAA